MSVCVCVCSLSYPARNAHAPYYIVNCGLSGSTIFSKVSHKQNDFRKKVIENTMCVSILSTTFV
jgi:inorganic pyrophosphatase/exopolyphosphatase